MTAVHSTDLGAFLRTRRAQLAPADVGLRPVAGERRRTPGLRREEVALLCGVSATWYTWLEQGRPISMSPAALARLATVLRLSRAERDYLFTLTRKRDPEPVERAAGTPRLPDDLAHVLKGASAATYCLDPVWEACGWNAAAAHLFAPWLAGPELNLLRWMFVHEAARLFVADWPERAKRLVAEFRAHAANLGNHAGTAALVSDLRRTSPLFASLWDGQIVLGRAGGLRRFRHPADGDLAFHQVTLVPTSHEAYKIVMLLPADVTP